MPTYEYRCRECGTELEVVQAFTDDPLSECPECGGDLRKKFSAVGISFKGSGFYKTDSRGSSGGATTGAGTSGSSESSSAASTSSDSSGSSSSGSTSSASTSA
ncbi:MAG: FmdB family zinc ribbon protein [Acidimicrobiales bacterium]